MAQAKPELFESRTNRGSNVKISGTEILKQTLATAGSQCKAVLNESGILFFPVSCEHRTMKIDGISYEDDYMGNALAAMVTAPSVEIRGHKDFSIERVKLIWNSVIRAHEARVLQDAVARYQGQRIS